MPDLLPSWPLFTAFAAASFVLAVTPGPGVFYIVARSLMQGRAAGLASVAGVALGNLGNAVGACVGLAALFAVSAAAFTVVKYAGAAYLFYLGWQAFKAPPSADATAPATPPASNGRIFRDGFVVALLNPKTAIFFAAFLPQFIDSPVSPILQSVMLAAVFVGMAAATDSLYALTAGVIAPYLTRARGVRAAGRYVTGGAFIGLGLLAAFSGSKRG